MKFIRDNRILMGVAASNGTLNLFKAAIEAVAILYIVRELEVPPRDAWRHIRDRQLVADPRRTRRISPSAQIRCGAHITPNRWSHRAE